MAKIAGLNSSQNMFSGQRKDFIIMRRDTFSYTGTYDYFDTNNILQTYDFTGCIGKMDIKKKKTDIIPLRVVSVSFNMTDYTLYLSDEETDLDAGRYYYDLQIKDADNNMVTKLYGEFKVLQDVTHLEGTTEEEFITSFLSEIEYYKSINERCEIIISSEISHKIINLGVHKYIVNMLNSVEYKLVIIYQRKEVNINMFNEIVVLYGEKKEVLVSMFNEINYNIYIYD